MGLTHLSKLEYSMNFYIHNILANICMAHATLQGHSFGHFRKNNKSLKFPENLCVGLTYIYNVLFTQRFKLSILGSLLTKKIENQCNI